MQYKKFEVSARLTQVRHDFTEDSEWRRVLPGYVPLLWFSNYGPLDAPESVPAGCAARKVFVAMIDREALS